MARLDPGSAGRVVRSATATNWKAKAKQAGASLKAEFEAGKSGDESPAAPIWPSPKEQLDALVRLLRANRSVPIPPPENLEADAEEVSQALRRVDWAGVRAATAERTSEATRAMRTMAEQVDWAKVHPVAAQVSSALIAAVASGQIGVGGRLGSTVARTIADQGGLGRRVAEQLDDAKAPIPLEFRRVIDTTGSESRDADTPGTEAKTAETADTTEPPGRRHPGS